METELLLNLAYIDLGKARISIGKLPFTSPDNLKALREKHRGTHILKRAGRNIIATRIDGNPCELGEQRESALSEELGLAALLTQEAFVRYFLSLKREVISPAPLKIISTAADDNHLAMVAPGGACPNWLTVRSVYEVDIRIVQLDERRAFLGLAVDIWGKRRIERTCQELTADGVDIRGLWATANRPFDDIRITPKPSVAGRISGLDGRNLILDQVRHDITERDASKFGVKADEEAFGRCLQKAFGGNRDAVANKLRIRLSSNRNGKVKLQKIRTFLEYLRKQKIELLPGSPISIGPFLEESNADRFPPVQQAPSPVFVFNPNGNQTDTSKPRGLDNFGPYTTQTHTPTRPRVCVICQASRKGQVEQFLHKFLNGVTPGTGRFPPFKKGLIRGYGLEGASTEFFLAQDDSAGAYHKAVQTALEHQTEKNFRWDIALVQTNESSHQLVGEQNPYFVTKAAFLSQQIPVQEFEAETMNYPSNQLEY